MLPDLPVDPCAEDVFELDTPHFRLTATHCPVPVLPETTGERSCSWTVVAVGSRVDLEPYGCDGAAPDWRFELSSPVEARTELLRVTTVSPSPDDARLAVFVASLPEQVLRLEVPEPLIRLREDPLCDVLESRFARVGGEPCNVTWVVDWFGHAWPGGISGCSASVLDGPLAWHPRFCPSHRDGIPQVYVHVEHIQP